MADMDMTEHDFTPGELDLYQVAAERWAGLDWRQILREIAMLFHLGVHIASKKS